MKFFQFSTCQWNLLVGVFVLLLVGRNFINKWFCNLHELKHLTRAILSGGFWVRPAQREVVKIKNFDFSYWASGTPWGHVLSLKTFCRNPTLSWAIRYSVFQKVKFTSSFEFVCGNPFSTFWHLMVKFG